jgi:cytoskeleton protein RodZ
VQPVAAPSTADAASAPALAVSGVVSQADAAAPRGETVFAAPPASAASAEVVSGLVQMRTSDASWIEVRDGSGRVLLSRTVMPGEGVGLDGTAPFRLVIGNAAATELTYRGRAVDLAPHTRDSVARVELK